MNYLNISLLGILLFIAAPVYSQLTIGVTEWSDETQEGYTFFSPFSGNKAYLIDNCGRLVNQWDRGTRPGLSAYFLDNGLMFRTYKVNPEGPFTSASNAGGIELVDWYNNRVWYYELNTATELSHHDAFYMPNGNILLLTWELVFTEELIEMGRDPNEIAVEGYMWSEKIIEIEPNGMNGGEVVWQWEIKDHYIQDFDPTKENYGVVSEHPELFDINLPELNSNNSNSTRDWNHFNAINYNEELDQILISVRNSDEVWIIDHSTTTEEAASHSGGLWGKGGDILYRWGNASAYGRAPISEQKLFGQHGVNWIQDGLADAGKILIYNNGNGRPGPDYSTAEILTPPQDANGNYIIPESDPIGPENSEIVYGDQSGETFYSAYLSNAQRLPNGNTLINAGSIGRVFEVDPDRNVVWNYVIPLSGDFPLPQGQNASNNATFRAYRYPPDYSGFEDIDLIVGNTIEITSGPLECDITVEETEVLAEELSIIYLPGEQIIMLSSSLEGLRYAYLIDAMGRGYPLALSPSNQRQLALPRLPNGIYFVHIQTASGKKIIKKILLF